MKVNQVIQAINEPFFTADGATNTAQLLVAGQPMVDPANVAVSGIQQTNWQGVLPLVQYSRGNYVLNSGNAATWSVEGSPAPTRTANAGPAPDGTNTACLVANTGATTGQGLYQTTTRSANAGDVITGFVLVKFASGMSQYRLQLEGAAFPAGSAVAVFDVVAGTIVSTSGASFGHAAIAAAGNGYYLLALTGVAPLAGTVNLSCCNAIASAWSAYLTFCQVDWAPFYGVYIPTTTAAVTQVDYTTANDQVTFGYTPNTGATFAWSGTADVFILSAAATLLAQYANSSALATLVDLMNQWLDPTAALDSFYNMVWNVETAQGVGLDVWGAIVDIPRTIQLVPPNEFFGFETSVVASFYPFNNRPFYSGPTQGEQFTLSDDAYRVLIMTKALANISSFTAPSVNALLRYLFAGRGSCYVLDLGNMQMQYVFNFALQPWEASVLQQPQLMPRPAGVGCTITVNP